jgi:hypothetical protein
VGLCFADARGANSTDRYFHGHRTLQLHQSLEFSVSLGQIRTFDFHICFAAFNFENTDVRGDLENICEPKKLKQSDKQRTLKVSTDLCFVSGWMHVEHWQFSLIVCSSSGVSAKSSVSRGLPQEEWSTAHSSQISSNFKVNICLLWVTDNFK